jgi:hypothetical protein
LVILRARVTCCQCKSNILYVSIPCVQTNVAIEQLQYFVEHDLDDIKLVSHEPFVRALFEMYEMDKIRSQVRAVCVMAKRSRLKPKSGKSDLMVHLFRSDTFLYSWVVCWGVNCLLFESLCACVCLCGFVQIDAGTISHTDVMYHFSELIEEVLYIYLGIAREVEGEIYQNDLISLFQLVVSIEDTGHIRALGASAFATDHWPSQRDHRAFIAKLTEERQHLEYFLQYSSGATHDYWDTATNHTHINQLVHTMEEALLHEDNHTIVSAHICMCVNPSAVDNPPHLGGSKKTVAQYHHGAHVFSHMYVRSTTTGAHLR